MRQLGFGVLLQLGLWQMSRLQVASGSSRSNHWMLWLVYELLLMPVQGTLRLSKQMMVICPALTLRERAPLTQLQTSEFEVNGLICVLTPPTLSTSFLTMSSKPAHSAPLSAFLLPSLLQLPQRLGTSSLLFLFSAFRSLTPEFVV